jgi:tetratricopeptide (TPR) repeat protein
MHPDQTTPSSSFVDGDTADPPPIQESSEPGDGTKASRRRRLLTVFGIYIAAIMIVGILAYFQGRQLQESQTQDELQAALQEQFELGVADLEAERYNLAQQRFEAIIRVDPSYPGAEEKITIAYAAIDVPTLTPTPLPTSTPDPSPPEQILALAKEALDVGDWSLAISKLLALRAKDSEYMAVEVDGLMYIALRSRGMEQITDGLMEEGLYDLSLAQRFGPLDRDAMFKWTLAQSYISANSYMGLNWLRASELFSPLCAAGATLDSCEKYGEAAWNYGDLEWIADNPCVASDYYQSSLEAWPNPTLEPTAEHAEDKCEDSRRPPPPPPPTEPTPTETPPPGNGGGT